jgi:hypothetical protein
MKWVVIVRVWPGEEREPFEFEEPLTEFPSALMTAKIMLLG